MDVPDHAHCPDRLSGVGTAAERLDVRTERGHQWCAPDDGRGGCGAALGILLSLPGKHAYPDISLPRPRLANPGDRASLPADRPGSLEPGWHRARMGIGD